MNREIVISITISEILLTCARTSIQNNKDSEEKAPRRNQLNYNLLLSIVDNNCRSRAFNDTDTDTLSKSPITIMTQD